MKYLLRMLLVGLGGCVGIVAVTVLNGLAWRQVRHLLVFSGVPREAAGEVAFWCCLLTGLPAVGLVVYAMGLAGERVDRDRRKG